MDMKNRVSAVDRVIDILEYLLSKNWPVSYKELANNLNIPKTSVYRIVKTLESRGYVYSPGTEGKFALGAKTISLGGSNREIAHLRQTANSFMYELANKTGFTVQLGVLFEYMVMYVEEIRTEKTISVIVPTGTPFPVNLSAGGKVLVANLPEDKREEFLNYTVLQANTPNSITDMKEFRLELTKVREKGYALDHEEFARGIMCIAAPVFNLNGVTIASLGITGHESTYEHRNKQDLIYQTMESAKKISFALGFR
jgi:DNA-binding IclR family transcriptional regulator